MKDAKRLTILCGHYGIGKTNVAVNIAYALKKERERVTIADLDIVNPYFRTKDSSDDFAAHGIGLICSEFANSNVDLPALPPELYAITDDRDQTVVLDIGGDDRGALALGRLAPQIKAEGDYAMLMVINRYRPLTPDAPSTIEVMREIETACGIPFTGLINNSNLGAETTAQDVIDSVAYAKSVEEAAGIPLVMTTAREDLCAELEGKVPLLFPLELQAKIGFSC